MPGRGDGSEGQTGADIDIHLGPGMAEKFQHREKPIKTGVALNRDMQAAGFPGLKRAEFFLKRHDLGQHLFRHPQHPDARRRQRHRFRAAHKQLHPHLRLKPRHLMRQCRLRHVHQIGGAGKATRLMDGADGAQVTEFQIHVPFSCLC